MQVLRRGREQRHIRSSGDPDELSEVAILSGPPRLPEMAEMSGNKTPDEMENARTIVKFLRDDINTAIKRERKEAQNKEDMDSVGDTGDVSESETSETSIRL